LALRIDRFTDGVLATEKRVPSTPHNRSPA
jgi:hypothetical protein